MTNEDQVKTYLLNQIALLTDKVNVITGTSWNCNPNIPLDVGELTETLRVSLNTSDTIIGLIRAEGVTFEGKLS